MPEPCDKLDSATQRLFEAAYRSHRSDLLRFLQARVANADDAADLVQEAYLSTLRYRDNQNSGSLRALLFAIASNLVFMRARRRRTRHADMHAPIHDLPLASSDVPLDQRLESEQRLRLLMEVIDQLPFKRRQVFVLSRFHELSYPQIAARCNISIKTVEKHITLALAACRARVGG